MRIISGSARGRKLAEFSDSGIRPTPDRVREAIFSILLSRFNSLHQFKVLELFAGTGAMSLEALSRGAQSAVLIDNNPQAARLITENSLRCRMTERARLMELPAFNALAQLAGKPPFELIFMDPPYNQGLIPPVLEQIAALHLLAQNGIICAESETGEDPVLPTGLELIETRHYGRAEVHFIKSKGQ
ncbi:16S rRNA (guanine(966)-N(2))-methyltransferase RsmD [Geopsychrobacter electrodiphilus]|uniref:16S rRNA (guanine(966)-N(2))-methyltransferase RsmD n=1 Tax=Geopsychrobacter electrodiphilus TaxID=225196 RepID=UPI000378A8CF|nr:16S rRNA (guanine(966)-N(2))-methyltransferase RsmD [Geopsychrobacter electrodiphilus]